MLLQISQNSQENTCAKDFFLMKLQIYSVNNFIKKEIPAQIFSCEFLVNNFFKDPFGRLLPHKRSFCLPSYHDLLFFEKRCHTYFPAGYFLGLICKLGTRVSSIFQTLSRHLFLTQLNICDGAFFRK